MPLIPMPAPASTDGREMNTPGPCCSKRAPRRNGATGGGPGKNLKEFEIDDGVIPGLQNRTRSERMQVNSPIHRKPGTTSTSFLRARPEEATLKISTSGI